MVLIECFTEAHIENIAACLRLKPKKMILMGEASAMGAPVKRYREILEGRNISTEIILKDIHGKDIADICDLFKSLLEAEEDYVIDLTGGDEQVFMAVGAALAGMDSEKRARVRVEQYSPEADAILDVGNDNRPVPCKPISLSVAELLRLHGALLHPDTATGETNKERKKVEKLWALVAKSPKAWNQNIAILKEFEGRADSKMQVFLHRNQWSYIPNHEEKVERLRDFLGELDRIGIISDESGQNKLEYAYESPFLRQYLDKAGNLLELKTLLEGRAVMENGVPFFQDCRMSVGIDWDGYVPEEPSNEPETRNEIDVILIHGVTPLFISCKNGNVPDEELYKLNTVANRFGGPYARKMLIATELSQKGGVKANDFLIQRAKDMGIHLVENAAKLSEEEWRDTLKNAVK